MDPNKIFTFTVGNIYPENSLIQMKFGFFDPKKELAKSQSQIPDIYFIKGQFCSSNLEI
jgi:hypothetical protein